MRTNVYVDGFNLFYGCLKGTPYRWLDIGALCARLFPRNEINRIRYFTARVDGVGDPARPQRQDLYIRALCTIPNLSIHYGLFKTFPTRLPLASPPPSGPRTAMILKREEKGSDVNLASYLLFDGFKKDFEAAIVFSNDSDLLEPVRMVRKELKLRVGIVNPHGRNRQLPGDFYREIRRAHVRAAQFPTVLTDHTGTFRRPKRWD